MNAKQFLLMLENALTNIGKPGCPSMPNRCNITSITTTYKSNAIAFDVLIEFNGKEYSFTFYEM